MADITKCNGKNCRKKEQCYRYTALANLRQSFFLAPPIKDDGECDYFINNK